MATTPLRLVPEAGAMPISAGIPELGRALVERGDLGPAALARALAMADRAEARLHDILVIHRLAGEDRICQAEAALWRARQIDPEAMPPDARLIDAVGVRDCIRHALLPWRRMGGAVVVATARPDRFDRHRPALEAAFGRVQMALVTEAALHRALRTVREAAMSEAAETRVEAAQSCRGTNLRRIRVVLGIAAPALVLAALAAPAAVMAVLAAWAVLTLALTMGLKIAAACAALSARGRDAPKPAPAIARLPVVSLLIPLYREHNIAAQTLSRLRKIDYPRELLDACLLLEADDHATRAALDRCRLPGWVRVIEVPAGSVRTKPRALNHGLDFCRGSIVGIYDAEDAPAPGQVRAVVERFHSRGPEVACLQGQLDYYNSTANWLARCFTIEYATWFRLILPGLERLGLVIPLGGTSLFFRRGAIEALGGWDAHNVTEDADLGLRLARHGYRAEIVGTVTEEEANARLWPWIRQRSRWQKGYAQTWAVHMSAPRRLWRELGPWRFFGVQVLFVATLSQVLLWPVMASFWLALLGLPHPLDPLLGQAGLTALALAFLAAGVANMALSALALAGTRHARLAVWIPTMGVYFAFATVAIFKGLAELPLRPHFWDKTEHGIFPPSRRAPPG